MIAFVKTKQFNAIEKVTHENITGEETCSSIDDQEKNLFLKNNTNAKRSIVNTGISLSILPIMYLLVSISTIFGLLLLRHINKKNYDSDIKYGKMNIPSYYDLFKINPLLFLICTLASSIIGSCLIIVLYSSLKQRFKVPEYEVHTYKLNIMLIFGLSANLAYALIGFSPFWAYFEVLSLQIQKEFSISFSHLLFIVYIAFTLLMTTYALIVMNILTAKDNGCGSTNCTKINNIQGKNWYTYKSVILSYLCAITLIYVSSLCHYHKIFTMSPQEKISDQIIYIVSFFPFFIHVINAVLMLSFYFELKYVKLALSQNLEVDYLFEEVT